MNVLWKITCRRVTLMRYEYAYVTVSKLSEWAENLADDIDFLDYWYVLSCSELKQSIDDCITNKINAFEWTRWRNDFEKTYSPTPGNGYDIETRYWFAYFTQMLVYVLQTSSKNIAEHYGRHGFERIMEKWYQYHTFGVDQTVSRFAETFGLPDGVAEFYRFGM